MLKALSLSKGKMENGRFLALPRNAIGPEEVRSQTFGNEGREELLRIVDGNDGCGNIRSGDSAKRLQGLLSSQSQTLYLLFLPPWGVGIGDIDDALKSE
jgi:hypothetical protein